MFSLDFLKQQLVGFRATNGALEAVNVTAQLSPFANSSALHDRIAAPARHIPLGVRPKNYFGLA